MNQQAQYGGGEAQGYYQQPQQQYQQDPQYDKQQFQQAPPNYGQNYDQQPNYGQQEYGGKPFTQAFKVERPKWNDVSSHECAKMSLRTDNAP